MYLLVKIGIFQPAMLGHAGVKGAKSKKLIGLQAQKVSGFQQVKQILETINYHGNPQPSFLRVITHMLGV